MLAFLLAAMPPVFDPQGPIFSAPSRRGLGGPSGPLVEFAMASGIGMGTQCACNNVTGTKGEVLVTSRVSVAECISNDGQLITQCPVDRPRISSGVVDGSILGVWVETTRTNDVLRSRDMSDAVWVKTNMTCARTATGMRNDANGASTCTASAASGTATQSIVFGSSGLGASVFIKRRTGTGTVEVTRDGATWIDITASLSSVSWKRVVPFQTPGCTSSVPPTGSLCIVVASWSAVASNPTVGIRLGTSGDAVDVDFWQLERSSAGDATTPIETAGATVLRAGDNIDLTLTGISLPTQYCASGTAVLAANIGACRIHGVPGDGTPGVGAGSGSYDDSLIGGSWVANTTATSPVSYTTGVTFTFPVIRGTSFYDGANLNGCINGSCGAGTAATYTPPTWTRYRMGAYSTALGFINGVQREVQLDSSATGCRRTL